MGITSDEIRSQFQTELIEIDITGFSDGPMEADPSMPPFLPASKIPVSIMEGSLAGKRCVRSDRSRFQTRNGSDDLEHRPSRVLSLNSFVCERVKRILHKSFPFFWRYVFCEGSKRRLAHNGSKYHRIGVLG